MNVYQRRGDRTLVPTLEKAITNTTTVVAGDFNAVHWTWMPGSQSQQGGDNYGREIAKWLDDVGMVNYNPPNQPTHEKDNTLNLVNTNSDSLTAYVDKELYYGLDY